jgi:hypothetical protein
MTFNIMAIRAMTFSIKGLFATLSVAIIQLNNTQHQHNITQYHLAKFSMMSVVILSVIILSAVMLTVIMLCVVAPFVEAPIQRLQNALAYFGPAIS